MIDKQGEYRILTINPGSTSTKIAIFDDEEPVLEKNIQHSELDLSEFDKVWDQYEFRKRMIVENLQMNGIEIESLSAVVGRGGLLRPVVSGTYNINKVTLSDARAAVQGEHASNLGCILAFGIAFEVPIATIVSPITASDTPRFAAMSRSCSCPASR